MSDKEKANVTVIPGEVEFRAYWIRTGRPFREMSNAWADYQAGRAAALEEAEKAIREVDPGAFEKGLIMMEEDAYYCEGVRDSFASIRALRSTGTEGDTK